MSPGKLFEVCSSSPLVALCLLVLKTGHSSESIYHLPSTIPQQTILTNTLSSPGYTNLSEYYFGNKKKAHKFCKSCGSSILIDFKLNEYGEKDPSKDILAVNVRFVFIFLVVEHSVLWDAANQAWQYSPETKDIVLTKLHRSGFSQM